MTVGVVAYLSVKPDASPKEVSRRRDFLADAARFFGAELVIVDEAGVGGNYPETVPSLEEALRRFVGSAIVHLKIRGEVHLGEFKHPMEPVVYVVGPDMAAEVEAPEGAVTVTLGADMLWAHQVIPVALWDRAAKAGTWPLL